MNQSALKTEPETPGIHMQNVTFGFQEAPLFEALDFTVVGGKWTCLLGPSGCGKSTLLRLISGGLRQNMTGSIRVVHGSEADAPVAWMAQKDLLLPWLTVLENVMLGDRLRGAASKETRTRALALLAQAGLSDCSNALPDTLSGGMRQRTALLRTLVENRPVILMDEPFSALDALTRLKLQDLAAKLVHEATVLLVTHDPLEALRLGHRIHVMTGRPAKMSDALIPPGNPPRGAGDPPVAALHQILLDQLMG